MKKVLLLLGVCACAYAQTTSYLAGSLTAEGTIDYCGSDTGSGNNYVCTNPANATVKAYRAGHRYSFGATHTNSGAATLAIDGLAARTIKKWVSSVLSDLGSGDIQTGNPFEVIDNGSVFLLINPANVTASGGGGGSTSPRVVGYADAATVTVNAGTTDVASIAAISQAVTFSNPSGAPGDGQQLIVRLKTVSSQALTWGTQFRGSFDLPLPLSTTGGGKVDYLKFLWNAASSTWDYLSKNAGF